MKKILLSVVAALAAVSFAAPIPAAEPSKKEAPPAAAAPAAGEIRKEEKKPVRKAGKARKARKTAKEPGKKTEAPATAPAHPANK